MFKYLVAYLAAAAAMLALDILWLGVIAKPMYQQAIGHLMAEQPRIVPALVFYVLYAFGMLVFVIVPNAGDSGWGRTLCTGALFGLVAYATYDLSNLATLRNWPIAITLADLAWGTVLSAVSAGAGKAGLTWGGRA